MASGSGETADYNNRTPVFPRTLDNMAPAREAGGVAAR
jgi:hypothetical protein